MNGADREYSIHLKVAAAESEFFFKVATGSSSLEQPGGISFPASSGASGDVQIKTQNGATTMIGCVAGSLLDLKRALSQMHGIDERRQRIFRQDRELVEDWRALTSCGVEEGRHAAARRP